MEAFFVLVGVITCVFFAIGVVMTGIQVWCDLPGSLPNEIERLRRDYKFALDRMTGLEVRISKLENPHDETR